MRQMLHRRRLLPHILKNFLLKFPENPLFFTSRAITYYETIAIGESNLAVCGRNERDAYAPCGFDR